MAAFAGKSFCLLGSMLPLIEYSGTRALVVRKTTKMLTGTGGLFDAAISLYSKIDPKLKVKSRDLILKFSTGAEIQFTYLDKPADKLNIQGREYSRICFDECQQLTEDNVMYALSRLRSTLVSYPLRAVATCNPDPDSFLMSFVQHSLDENLVPVRQPNYPNRYYVRHAGQLCFFGSVQELLDELPSVAPEDIKSYKFVPGTIWDNPKGIELNKDYISTLKNLPDVERRRLLDGAWVREISSGYFKRDWVSFVPFRPKESVSRVRAWDLAFTEPSEARPRVDATAGVLVSKNKANVYTVEDVIIRRKRVHEVERTIFQTAEADGRDVTISLPLDPGATAGAYCRDLARRLTELGFYVKLVRPEKGKLQRFLPFAATAEAGYVNIVKSDWTELFVSELEQTQFNAKTFDDQADAVSDAFYVLNKVTHLPDFSLPDLSGSPSGIVMPSYSFTGSTLPSFPNFSI